MKPKKSLGQNFLNNDTVARRIVDAIVQSDNTDRILEVGPGRGALTKHLISHKEKEFKAIETDRDLLEFLYNKYPDMASCFIHGNFLKKQMSEVFDGRQFSVVGNFPYNISSQILFHIEASKEYIPLVIGMFQKEVAQRITAKEGSKIYGVTSVLFGSSYNSKILFKVNPTSFYPVPKVTSAVLKMERKKDITLPCKPSLFRTVVKMSFNQRRKMLRNSLKALIKNPDLLQHPIMTRRPEQLSLEDYYELTNLVQNQD